MRSSRSKAASLAFLSAGQLVIMEKMSYSCIMDKIRFFALFFSLGIIFPFFSLAGNDPVNSSKKPEKIILKINGQAEEVYGDTMNEWFRINPTLFRQSSKSSEILNVQFCPYQKYFCDFIMPIRENNNVSIVNQETVYEEKVKSYLEDLARRTDKSPIDAKFQVEDGRVTVFSLSENGSKIDIEKSLTEIKNNLNDSNQSGQTDKELEMTLISDQIKPEISSAEVDNLGISELIGEGKSNFRGSPKNRIFNINVATSRFNGVLIEPGEEFSFVKILGEVDGEHGYLPELVIKQDKTEPEFGGGICQVSTTTFRAAIYSGLEITARTPHAYPVSYYNPQGLDATVYVPRPDLRFINNTPGHILIQTKIEGTELTFQFYGTSDGRTIEIDGPRIIERKPDGSMKATFTQIVKDRNGNIMIEDVFNSAYDSPSKYPHPGEENFTTKPKDWSKKQWEEYKKTH